MNNLFPSVIVRPVAVLLLAAASIFPQGRQKVIEWAKSPVGSEVRTPPNILPLDRIDGLELEAVAAVGKRVTIGRGFVADDDWLRTITFRVKNISGRQLKAVQLTLILPEIGIVGGPDIVFCYGCAEAEREKGIAPGEKFELKILSGDSYYEWVKGKIKARGDLSRISKAQIREVVVTLPGDLHWLSGCVKTASAKNSCPRAGNSHTSAPIRAAPPRTAHATPRR